MHAGRSLGLFCSKKGLTDAQQASLLASMETASAVINNTTRIVANVANLDPALAAPLALFNAIGTDDRQWDCAWRQAIEWRQRAMRTSAPTEYMQGVDLLGDTSASSCFVAGIFQASGSLLSVPLNLMGIYIALLLNLDIAWRNLAAADGLQAGLDFIENSNFTSDEKSTAFKALLKSFSDKADVDINSDMFTEAGVQDVSYNEVDSPLSISEAGVQGVSYHEVDARRSTISEAGAQNPSVDTLLVPFKFYPSWIRESLPPVPLAEIDAESECRAEHKSEVVATPPQLIEQISNQRATARAALWGVAKMTFMMGSLSVLALGMLHIAIPPLLLVAAPVLGIMAGAVGLMMIYDSWQQKPAIRAVRDVTKISQIGLLGSSRHALRATRGLVSGASAKSAMRAAS